MKRITVVLTLGDDAYISARELRGIKSAMVNAAVEKATLNDLPILAIQAKIGTPRKNAA